MDENNWRPAGQGESNSMDGNVWRAHLSLVARHKIVTKIMETLKKRLPTSGPEGLGELQKMAVRFEEKIYTAAISQSDYLRKIAMKMFTMENKSQPVGATTSLPPKSAGGNQNAPDPGRNQGQPLSMPPSQSRQQLLPQNLPNTTTQSSAGLPSALSSISNVVGQGSYLQSISGISQNAMNNSVGQAVPSNMFANSQRQMDGKNWRPAGQGESNSMDGNYWRVHLSPDARHKIVNRIMETLKKHLPISGPEGLGELQKIAVRFEEKIYTAATSQSDYLRKISMKMLTMENKSQPVGATSSLPPNSAGGNQNTPDPGSDVHKEMMCAVCLGFVELGHEIRELSNCAHMFHVGCLDKWVDQGQVTCPLCRSKLLPDGEKIRGRFS